MGYVYGVTKESDTTEGLNNESRGLEGGKGEAVLDEEFLGKASLEASLFHVREAHYPDSCSSYLLPLCQSTAQAQSAGTEPRF